MAAKILTTMDDRRIHQPVIYQMKVSLLGVKPSVWRRFQIRSDSTFYQLHLVLQTVMGWKNYHLYQFDVAGVELSDPVTAAEFGTKDAEQIPLDHFLQNEITAFHYEYDFCDGWRHEVVIEKQLPLLNGAPPFLCLAGERACPPEDSGGVKGYAALLQQITKPHRESTTRLLPGDGRFDPEAFDVNQTNVALQALREMKPISPKLLCTVI